MMSLGNFHASPRPYGSDVNGTLEESGLCLNEPVIEYCADRAGATKGDSVMVMV